MQKNLSERSRLEVAWAAVIMEFSVLRGTGQVKSRVRTLNLRKANFWLFRAPVRGIAWETALRGKGVNESWEIFKDNFLRAQELSVLMCKKSGRGGRKPAWLRPPSQTKTQTQKAQAAEAGIYILGRL